MLHLEIIAFNESEELLELIGLGLPIDILQIDSFWDVGMDINVMTAMDTGEPKPEGFGACDGFGKTDIFGAGQQLLEEPTPSTLCHWNASVVLRGSLSLLLLPMASFLVKPNIYFTARRRLERPRTAKCRCTPSSTVPMHTRRLDTV